MKLKAYLLNSDHKISIFHFKFFMFLNESYTNFFIYLINAHYSKSTDEFWMKIIFCVSFLAKILRRS